MINPFQYLRAKKFGMNDILTYVTGFILKFLIMKI